MMMFDDGAVDTVNKSTSLGRKPLRLKPIETKTTDARTVDRSRARQRHLGYTVLMRLDTPQGCG